MKIFVRFSHSFNENYFFSARAGDFDFQFLVFGLRLKISTAK